MVAGCASCPILLDSCVFGMTQATFISSSKLLEPKRLQQLLPTGLIAGSLAGAVNQCQGKAAALVVGQQRSFPFSFQAAVLILPGSALHVLLGHGRR